MTLAVQLTGVSKSYGSTRVLHDVSFDVHPGTIVSLIGENGAGKSTVAKIIAGITQADAGSVSIFGNTVSFTHPAQAMAAGVGIVHQEISLLDNLTVAENICLGREPMRGLFIDRKAMDQVATEALAKLSVSIDPLRRVSSLSLAQKQLIEIARAVSGGASIILFDEPTSSLSEHDAEHLLATIKGLTSMGVTILYVSHRLSEVMQISDKVVALRDGTISAEITAPLTDRQKLISSMIGREMRDLYDYRPRTKGDPVLTLSQFRASQEHAPLDLTVHSGEIVGIAGLVGSGRSDLLEAIYGVRVAAGGSSTFLGTRLPQGSAHAALTCGVALVPENRKEQGLVGESTISDTISLAPSRVSNLRYLRSKEAEVRAAQDWIHRLAIACAGPEQAAIQLSGGNQQKVVLAKCLASGPSLLLLDEPTRGIDIAARHSIYELLFSLAEQGLAILFVSSELEEVMGIADRVLVMNDGRVTGDLERSQFSEHSIISLASHQEDLSTSTNTFESAGRRIA